MSKFKSITTPDFYHDVSNFLTELLLVNSTRRIEAYPWRSDNFKKFWSTNLPIIKKLQKKPFSFDVRQIAWYIYTRSPESLSSSEFAKLAFSCRRLFKTMDIEDCGLLISKRVADNATTIIPVAKSNQKMTLEEFLKTLEEQNG